MDHIMDPFRTQQSRMEESKSVDSNIVFNGIFVLDFVMELINTISNKYFSFFINILWHVSFISKSGFFFIKFYEHDVSSLDRPV